MLNDLKDEHLLHLLSCKGNIELYWQIPTASIIRIFLLAVLILLPPANRLLFIL